MLAKPMTRLVAKWTPLAPAVVRSLEEAGNQLLTFYEFHRAMWKSIRTTNALENLNREFRRRTKTQASFSSEESVVALLFGLIASGQIQLRRIDGYQRLSEVLEHARGSTRIWYGPAFEILLSRVRLVAMVCRPRTFWRRFLARSTQRLTLGLVVLAATDMTVVGAIEQKKKIRRQSRGGY